MDKKVFSNLVLDQERALYGIANASVTACAFRGARDGESCLKETNNLFISDCAFDLRYPVWHTTNTKIVDCKFSETSRAPLWYGKNVEIDNCSIKSVKAVRECENIVISNSDIASEEFGWRTNRINLSNCKLDAVYALFESSDITFENVDFSGKYSFQYIKNATFDNCRFSTKDAFWHGENIVVKNSVVKGEYLGWYSKNLTFINCQIEGTQPLCYAENLRVIDCTMTACDLSFEHSTVEANVLGEIDSVKNAIGTIKATKISEIIKDEHARGECKFILSDN